MRTGMSYQKAYDLAKDYCIKNGLNYKRLNSLRFENPLGYGFFVAHLEEPNVGLEADLETLPNIVLVVEPDLKIKTTEHTNRYLT